MNILSLGAGVQSSALALMAAQGEIVPMPDYAIFADTGNEPESVYKWLAWLEKRLPFPVQKVSKGNLGEISLEIKRSKFGNNYTKGSIPAFIIDANGSKGILKRQCTTHFKIGVIHQATRKIIGRKRDAKCIMWIGISIDEIERIKPSRKMYIQNRYPLIENNISREKCLAWMKANGYPQPPRSACVFCPYHNDKEWKLLKDQEPLEFQKAVEYEGKLQVTMAQVTGFRGKPFLHRSCQPLESVNFNPDRSQLDMFNNECEGMCGV